MSKYTSTGRAAHAQYLSKWDSEELKTVELERRLTDVVQLYEAFADQAAWQQIRPRLVEVESRVLDRLSSVDDIWKLSPTEFEQMVAELLDKLGFRVLWIPGGDDQGIDIVASSRTADYFIDVKRYRQSRPVGVELVRHVYGVATAIDEQRSGTLYHGGIITSSRFTRGADAFRQSVRVRPLLRDGHWIRATLGQYVPRLRVQ